MADLNIQLLDTGENFILISADTETEIEYGQLAVSLVNTDYNDMYDLLSDFLQSNRLLRLATDLQGSSHAGTLKPEIISLITKSLYKPMHEFLGKEYLTPQQAVIITMLLMADIRSRLADTIIDLDKPEYYIPLIYSDVELHQHIRNILLEKDFAFINPLQDRINQVQLTSSIIITKCGQPFQSYTITDIFDYLILDLQKYLTGKKKVNDCKCCGKLFYPKYRSSELYCYFNNSDCKEKMKRKTDDEFAKKRDAFRGYQSGRIWNESTLKQYNDDTDVLKYIYKKWSKECTEKYHEYKSKDDLKGFDDWFNRTKFTPDRLKQEYEEYLKTKELS